MNMEMKVVDKLAVQRAFTRIAFTEAVKAEQQARGTREFCANLERRQPSNDVLAPRAIAFIESVVCNPRDFRIPTAIGR